VDERGFGLVVEREKGSTCHFSPLFFLVAQLLFIQPQVYFPSKSIAAPMSFIDEQWQRLAFRFARQSGDPKPPTCLIRRHEQRDA
jgi:hypothetical protein